MKVRPPQCLLTLLFEYEESYMTLKSINPATEEVLNENEVWSEAELDRALEQTAQVAPRWAATPIEVRCAQLRRLAELLRGRREKLALLITREMGKLIGEARAEIDKCAWACEYYADHAANFLSDEPVASPAHKSYVKYQPLGPVLAIMPWNFPFWQVFRFAAPAVAAGNTALLKHASNVTLCALAIQDVFDDADFPSSVFKTLVVPTKKVAQIIKDPRVRAVTITGSVAAGRSVAKTAGENLKKTVLELGGSDAFVVLADADLEQAAKTAVASRFQNVGQSCIAAKRFIVEQNVADDFLALFKEEVTRLKPGNPLDEETTLGPMARGNLREELHKQVTDALDKGATAITGCEPVEGRGYYYAASILDGVKPDMRTYREETFGPVAAVICARDEDEALELANDSEYGLGGSIWTQDLARGERFASRMACGSAFVNQLVKSDPRVPFGGIKDSGYGRELSYHGIREFTNIKTMWVD
jgi:succinate-semialdehyde dehydrogenase/glutarate-semialdehyde dehydrogenase